MVSELRPKLTPFINKIATPFAAISPNLISVIGIIFPVLFFWFMHEQQYVWAFVMLLGSTFDLLDGAVARLTNKVSAFGGLLDSTLDRLADGFMILAFYFAGLAPIELISIILVESFLISYIRAKAGEATKGMVVLNVGIIERPERLILLAAALLATNSIFVNIQIYGCTLTQTILIVLAVLSFITVMQRIYLAYKKLHNA